MPVWIYQPKATQEELQTNGIGVVDVTSAVVHEEINGEFSITLNIPPGAQNFNAVIGGAIVKADTPRGQQYFRLSKPVFTLGGGIEVFGWHISYDLAQTVIVTRAWEGKSGAEVLPEILQAGIGESRFTGVSDIETVVPEKVTVKLMSVLNTLIGEENSFLAAWGGEIERDNFTVNMKAELGEDNGVTIRYRKNLTGLMLDENHDDIANRIIPVGRTPGGNRLLILEGYIDSPRINDTPVPHVRVVEFEDVQIQTEDEDGNIPYPTWASAREELANRVAQMYANGADLPTVTATVTFVELSKTEEYKDYAVLETVNLGDTVTCIYDEYNIALKQRVTAYDYDAINGKYVNIVLGNTASTLGDGLWAQESKINRLWDNIPYTVKQGQTYNGVTVDRDNGLVARSTIGAQEATAQFNEEGAAWYDSEGKLIGGLAEVGGLIALIASVLTNDIDDKCYATIGSTTLGGYQYSGIFIYHKDYSTTAPIMKLVAYQNGDIALSSDGHGWLQIFHDGALAYYDQNGNNRLLLNSDGSFSVWDTAARLRLSMHATDSFIRAPGATNHAIGADPSGPYRVKNGTKTYF